MGQQVNSVNVTEEFNKIVRDTEWQEGVTEEQRRIGVNFAYEILVEALHRDDDVAQAGEMAREALRRFANLRRANNAKLNV